MKVELEFSKEDLEKMCIEKASKLIDTREEGEFKAVYQGAYATSVKLEFAPKKEKVVVEEQEDKETTPLK